MSRLTRSEWLKTPYAASDARDPDKSVRDVLAKRGVRDTLFIQTTGPNGRSAYGVRFLIDGKAYRIGLEVLNAQASDDELVKQAKRAVYHLLKSLLEFSTVFAPLEQVLFAYLESNAGPTMYEIARPQLERLQAPSFAGILSLPPKTD